MVCLRRRPSIYWLQCTMNWVVLMKCFFLQVMQHIMEQRQPCTVVESFIEHLISIIPHILQAMDNIELFTIQIILVSRGLLHACIFDESFSWAGTVKKISVTTTQNHSKHIRLCLAVKFLDRMAHVYGPWHPLIGEIIKCFQKLHNVYDLNQAHICLPPSWK